MNRGGDAPLISAAPCCTASREAERVITVCRQVAPGGLGNVIEVRSPASLLPLARIESEGNLMESSRDSGVLGQEASSTGVVPVRVEGCPLSSCWWARSGLSSLRATGTHRCGIRVLGPVRGRYDSAAGTQREGIGSGGVQHHHQIQALPACNLVGREAPQMDESIESRRPIFVRLRTLALTTRLMRPAISGQTRTRRHHLSTCSERIRLSRPDMALASLELTCGAGIQGLVSL